MKKWKETNDSQNFCTSPSYAFFHIVKMKYSNQKKKTNFVELLSKVFISNSIDLENKMFKTAWLRSKIWSLIILRFFFWNSTMKSNLTVAHRIFILEEVFFLNSEKKKNWLFTNATQKFFYFGKQIFRAMKTRVMQTKKWRCF